MGCQHRYVSMWQGRSAILVRQAHVVGVHGRRFIVCAMLVWLAWLPLKLYHSSLSVPCQASTGE
jgi:hypothetical protein